MQKESIGSDAFVKIFQDMEQASDDVFTILDKMLQEKQ